MIHSIPAAATVAKLAKLGVLDTGRIRVGAGWRLLPANPRPSQPADHTGPGRAIDDTGRNQPAG